MTRLVCIVLLLGTAAAAAREKTDTVVLRNGDHITGEIIKLAYGKLEFKTADIGTLSVEWTAVASLRSHYTFDVELVNGEHYFGTITPSADGQRLLIGYTTEPFAAAPIAVARIAQLDKSWRERINGSLSFGYNYTKSSGITVLTGHFDAAYRAVAVAMGLRVDTNSTNSPQEGTLDRDSIAFNYQWVRPERKFWAGLASLERNEELGIDGRLQLGAGLGRYFRQTASSEVSGLVGVVVNQEWVTGAEPGQQSVEGLLVGTWRVFRFRSPETSLTSSVALFPSFTEAHRYRAGVNLSLRREIIENFFLDLSAYYDYDSEPPSEDPARDDYGLVTSIGYSF